MADRVHLAAVSSLPAGRVVSVRARLRHVQPKLNALGDRWAALVMEEDGTCVTVLVFARTFGSIPEGMLTAGTLLDVTGRVTFRSVDQALRIFPTSITAATQP